MVAWGLKGYWGPCPLAIVGECDGGQPEAVYPAWGYPGMPHGARLKCLTCGSDWGPL